MKTKLFGFYLLASFASASLGYLLVGAVMGEHVFGGLYRMFLYHLQHPFQYIALACLVFSALAAAFTPRIARLASVPRFVAILGVMLGSVLLASVPGGVLWSVHDMQAGSFPAGARFWGALAWGASTGLQIGWLVIALSLPYNLLGLLAGYFIMTCGLRLSTAPSPAAV